MSWWKAPRRQMGKMLHVLLGRRIRARMLDMGVGSWVGLLGCRLVVGSGQEKVGWRVSSILRMSWK
jgi:hypothetical protein